FNLSPLLLRREIPLPLLQCEVLRMRCRKLQLWSRDSFLPLPAGSHEPLEDSLASRRNRARPCRIEVRAYPRILDQRVVQFRICTCELAELRTELQLLRSDLVRLLLLQQLPLLLLELVLDERSHERSEVVPARRPDHSDTVLYLHLWHDPSPFYSRPMSPTINGQFGPKYDSSHAMCCSGVCTDEATKPLAPGFRSRPSAKGAAAPTTHGTAAAIALPRPAPLPAAVAPVLPPTPGALRAANSAIHGSPVPGAMTGIPLSVPAAAPVSPAAALEAAAPVPPAAALPPDAAPAAPAAPAPAPK